MLNRLLSAALSGHGPSGRRPPVGCIIRLFPLIVLLGLALSPAACESVQAPDSTGSSRQQATTGYVDYSGDRERPEATEPPWERRPEGGYAVVLGSAIYPDGEWRADVNMNRDEYRIGQTMEIAADLEVNSEYLTENLDSIDGLVACLSSVRLYDAQGNPHRQSNTNMSTLITSNGLPIESYLPGQASHKLGRAWTGPIDEVQVVERDGIEHSDDRLSVRFELKAELAPGFPEGYYRPVLNFYVLKDGEVVPISVYPGLKQVVDDRQPLHLFEIIRYAFWTHRLPMVRIGEPEDPQMVWTLFSGYFSNGTQGVVAVSYTHLTLPTN